MKPGRLIPRCNAFHRALSTHNSTYNPKYVNFAKGGKENFLRDFEKSHVQTTLFQKLLLGVGSGVISITSPSRGDMIAVMGEVTGYQSWEYIQSEMQKSDEGRQILEEKPRISSGSVDLEKLKSYPDGTLGKAYSNFLTRYGYSPDTRNAVQFVDDLDLAYVAQRYREAHDLFHTLLDMPTNMLGEVTVKWVEAIQLKLPMCAAGALFGSVRLAPKFTRAYSTISIVKLDQEVAEKVKKEIIKPKEVPGSMHLPCVQLPEFYRKAISLSLEGQSKRLIRKEAEALNHTVNTRPLPLERHEVEIEKKRLYKQLQRDYLDEDDVIRWNALDKEVEKRLLGIFGCQKMFWKPIQYNMHTSFQYLISRIPGEYAVLKKVLREIAKRDETFAPKALLDFGSGCGSVNWVAHELWGNSIEEYYCVDVSQHMHDLAGMLLTENNTSDKSHIENIYYRHHLPISNKAYDIVVSAFTLLELENREFRMKVITKLWNSTKDYLVIIENGNNPGFKVITEVRDYLIEANKNHGIDYHIFAPCPHEYDCPILTTAQTKSLCRFSVLYNNFPLYKKGVVGEQFYSFVVFKKRQAPPPDRKCRFIKKVIKKHRRAHCWLCTTDGDIKQIVVTKSKYDKSTYDCMRKARGGDLLSGVVEEIEKLDFNSKKLIRGASPRLPVGQEDSNSEDCDDKGEYYSDDESDDESTDRVNENSRDSENTDVDKKS